MKNANPRWVIYGLALVLLLVFVGWASGTGTAATPGVFTGKASALIPVGELPTDPTLRYTRSSTSPLTDGPRAGLRSSAGADYQNDQRCPSSPGETTPCTGANVRVLAFKTAAGAQAHWKGSCSTCASRRDAGGWSFKQTLTMPDPGLPRSITNAQVVTITALCGNLVVAVRGANWGGDGRYARRAVQYVVDQAEAMGMSSCNVLKQEPGPRVFARGTAENRGKAVAVGSVTAPTRIVLRVRSTGAGRLYVQYTMTCTNGKRTETTTDEGMVDLPLLLALPIGISPATRCTVTASAFSIASANVEVRGTHVVELARG